MSQTLQGFPFFPLAFDKNQQSTAPNAENELIQFAKAADRPLDLFVISHGWNNNIKRADELYNKFFTEVRQALEKKIPAGLEQCRFAVAGVYWPSMKFTEAEQIPGGVAGATGIDKLDSLIESAVEIATPAQARILEQLSRSLAGKPDKDKVAQSLRQLLTESDDPERETTVLPETLEGIDNSELLHRLSGDEQDQPALLSEDTGGAAGGTEDFFGKISSSVRNALNIWTYWTMKDRAGKIGANALAPLLDRLVQEAPHTRIYLIGHSFGARLVTAAAMAGSFQPHCLILLQAAFSHNSFSPDGFFRKVITEETRVKGPVLVSFSTADRAVGMAYPIASRLKGDWTSAIGDADDKYGGLGRNGAQRTSEATTVPLAAVGSIYEWTSGPRIFNLDSSKIITDHSDICKPEIAYALLSSILPLTR